MGLRPLRLCPFLHIWWEMIFYWTYILFKIPGVGLGPKIGPKRAKIFQNLNFSIFLFRIPKVMLKHWLFVLNFFLHHLLFHFWVFGPIWAKKHQNFKEQRSWKKLIIKSWCFSITLGILWKKVEKSKFWKILVLFGPIFGPKLTPGIFN